MYHPISKLLHWVVGLYIVGMLVMGLLMEDVGEFFGTNFIGIHKSLGAILLGLVVLRVLWWLGQTKPALVKTLPAWVAPYINLGHNVLYGFMAVLPFSGWLMSNAAGYPVSVFGWFTLPTLVEKNLAVREAMGEVHEYAAWVLIVMLVAHVAAAVYHHRVLKDDTLTRMMLGK